MTGRIELGRLRYCLSREGGLEPIQTEGKEYAAVSIVIVNESIILEKRASIEGDPWSSQYSLPGGRYERSDGTLRTTAVRETMEEVGVDLEEGEYLGFFGPFSPMNRPGMDVYAHVFRLNSLPIIRRSGEVDEALLVPLMNFNSRDREFIFDNIRVWGLTARILNRFCGMIGL
ncbi:MAG: NUDIX hydrolase [Thermoplasmata archaeon]